jgi:nucleoid-associated protein YgaU
VRDFMRAYLEGIHYAKTHRKETLDILAKYLRTDDREVLEETYENIVLTLVPEKPYPTLKGIQIMLREMVDRLYKTQPVAKATPPRAEPAPALASKTTPTRVEPAPARVEPAPPTPSKPVAPLASAAQTEQTARATTKLDKPEPVRAATAAQTSAAPTSGTTYVVEAGDNLTRISLKFYNSNYKWMKIYDANRDTLKNPNYIYIGQSLIIPPDDGR